MGMDAFVLNAVAKEIEERLIQPGARVNKIYQSSTAELVLHFRGEFPLDLFISADPGGARIHFAEEHRSRPPSPPPFCMLLRKHLHKGRLVSTTLPPLERVLYLHFVAPDLSSREVHKTLAVEIMGRHSNVILLDSPGEENEQRILGALKNIPPSMNRFRTILPNYIYAPPPVQQKLHPFALNYEYFKEEMSRLEGRPASEALLKTLQGLSPFLAQEIATRAGVDTIDKSTLPSLWDSLQEMISLYEQRTWQPHVILDRGGTPVDYCAFKPLSTQGNGFLRPCSTMSEAIADYHTFKEGEKAKKELYHSMERQLQQTLKKIKKKEKVQRAELEKTRQADDYRLCGELILANLNKIPSQATEVTLLNFYSQEGEEEEVKVTLDPSIPPAINAQRYFKKYRKARQGYEKIRRQLQLTRSDIQYLESVLFNMQKSSLSNLLEIRKELEETGFIQQQKKKEHKSKEEKAPPPSPPLKYYSSEGDEIYVGRNNRQNEYLVRHLSSKEDYWFHVKEAPGAHVIVKNENPGETTMFEAALLAAYYSKATQSSNVPVDYTQVKHLSRHPSKKPGMVTYRSYSTLNVTPSRDALEHILKHGD